MWQLMPPQQLSISACDNIYQTPLRTVQNEEEENNQNKSSETKTLLKGFCGSISGSLSKLGESSHGLSSISVRDMIKSFSNSKGFISSERLLKSRRTPNENFNYSNYQSYENYKEEDLFQGKPANKKNLTKLFEKAMERKENSKEKEKDLLQVQENDLFNTPIKKRSRIKKEMFTCTESTKASESVNKMLKRKRYKKTPNQINLLTKFFEERKDTKTFCRNELKEICLETNLSEDRVYKWLWDQKIKLEKTQLFAVRKME
ncbi:MAG: homeobox domain-containing protein [archaeon]|nr:homeobox domain-containing protein [archaeon]